MARYSQRSLSELQITFLQKYSEWVVVGIVSWSTSTCLYAMSTMSTMSTQASGLWKPVLTLHDIVFIINLFYLPIIPLITHPLFYYDYLIYLVVCWLSSCELLASHSLTIVHRTTMTSSTFAPLCRYVTPLCHAWLDLTNLWNYICFRLPSLSWSRLIFSSIFSIPKIFYHSNALPASHYVAALSELQHSEMLPLMLCSCLSLSTGNGRCSWYLWQRMWLVVTWHLHVWDALRGDSVLRRITCRYIWQDHEPQSESSLLLNLSSLCGIVLSYSSVTVLSHQLAKVC